MKLFENYKFWRLLESIYRKEARAMRACNLHVDSCGEVGVMLKWSGLVEALDYLAAHPDLRDEIMKTTEGQKFVRKLEQERRKHMD